MSTEKHCRTTHTGKFFASFTGKFSGILQKNLLLELEKQVIPVNYHCSNLYLELAICYVIGGVKKQNSFGAGSLKPVKIKMVTYLLSFSGRYTGWKLEMTREGGTELPLQPQEMDGGAGPQRVSPANTVRGTTERTKAQERPESTE